ncbi:MAG: ABC transporter permease [Bdellovibrionales bacterium]|nr:ABC transporter permease [Bdellovibrionales bacterium]
MILDLLSRAVGPAVVVLLLALTVVVSFFGYDVPAWLWWMDALSLGGALLGYSIRHHLLVYFAKRFVEALFVLFVIASATFLLLRIIPGGPFDRDKALPPEVIKNIEAKYNLDAPLYEQYFQYMAGLARGDLGESYKYIGRNVTTIIGEALPASFQLGFYSLILAFLVGIPLGVFAASKHNTWWDSLAMFGAISGVSLPNFLVGPILILIFCFSLDLLPPAFWEGPEYYILPVITLGLRPAAVIARLTRANVLDVISADYIRTAKAKGLGWPMVLFKHVLKNSLIPVLTFSGPLAAGILSGSFVIELIFNIPGIGKHFVESVSNRDYPLILGVTLVFSAMLVLANLIVDLLYSYFDPRIDLTK